MSHWEENDFPPMPPVPSGDISWPSSVDIAYFSIKLRHQQGIQLLNLDNGDIARLKITCASITNECIPLLSSLHEHGVPPNFIELCLEAFAVLVTKLESVIINIGER
jgi:hypothetical protein